MAVLGERPMVDAKATAEAGGAPSPSLAGNDEILGWLDILLKGKPDQQAVARTEIGMILEARGFVDDAEEAYWTNVQARVADRRSYERLIALYQLRKDRLSETLVRRQLAEVFGQQESPRPVPAGTAHGGAVSVARQLTAPAGQVSPPPPRRRLRSASRAATEPGGRTPLGSRGGAAEPPHPATASSQGRRQPRTSGDGVVSRPMRSLPAPAPSHRPDPLPVRYSDAPPHRAPAQGGPQAVPLAEIIPPTATGRRRRRVPLLPNPGADRRQWSSDGRVIALQPATMFALLIASFGAAALIAFMVIAADRGMVRPAFAGASAAPARCIDASGRFPGAYDPRGAVVSAYRQQGVDVEAPRPGGPRLTADQAEQVVGGWMSTSLMLEHAGQPAPTLNEWLDSESDRPTLANAILAGRRLDSMLTPEEWAEMRSWPATSCEGAFMHDPRNADLVRLMERVVAG